MAQRSEYQVVMGNGIEINKTLPSLASGGWKPILMSSSVAANGQINVILVMEHVIGS